MIVTAALVWYDERPEDLERCVRGMANIADRLVAVDGAYQRYPDAKVSSPREQTEIIMETARRVGLGVSVHIPNRLWLGQVEKRSYVLSHAALGSDWIAIVDTDWVIRGDREEVRAELERQRINVDVMSAPLYTPPGKSIATGWHKKEAGQRYQIPTCSEP